MKATDAKRRNTREEATRERRAKITEAAVACFLEAGFQQTGVRDIAQRAGVSLGNVYNHFPGKDEILAQIAEAEQAALDPILDILATPSSPLAALHAFISTYGRYAAHRETVILTVEITREAIRKPDLGASFLANRARLISALSTVIRMGVEAGELRPDLDADDAARRTLHLIEADAFDRVLADPSPTALEQVRAFILITLSRA